MRLLHAQYTEAVELAEGAGEDPFLGSAFAAARVRGFQGNLSAADSLGNYFGGVGEGARGAAISAGVRGPPLGYPLSYVNSWDAGMPSSS